MKKLFLTLVALVTVFTASAVNWYISGQFQGWSHANPSYQFKEVSSGVFSIDINKQDFAGEFLICQGTDNNPDWNNKIGGATNMEADKEYTYVAGGGNFSVKGVINCSKIEFNTNTKKIIIYGVAAENDYSTVYLVGDINGSGWNEGLTNYPLTLKSGTTNVWEGNYSITNTTSYFKMKAGNYIYGTGGEDINVVMGTTYTASKTGNAFVLGKGDYTFSYVLDKNADTGELTVTGTSTGGGDTGGNTDYGKWYVNILGPFNGWGDNGVQPNDENITTTTDLAIGTQGFKVKVWDGSVDSYYVAATPTIPTDEWVQLIKDDVDAAPIQIQGATESSVYTVKYNVETNQVYVVGDGGTVDPEPTPEGMYIIGEVIEGGWGANNGVAMNDEGDGIYTYEFTVDKTSYFGFATKLGANADDWNTLNSNRYGAAEENGDGHYLLSASDFAKGEVELNVKKGETAWGVPAGTYTVTFSLEDMILAIEGTPEEGGDVPTPGEEKTIYLRGDVNEWGTGEAYAFVKGTDGTYSLKLDALSGNFKVASEDWETVNLGGDGQGQEVEAVNAILGNNTLWQGSTVNLTAGNWTNVELTLTYTYGENSATLNIKADASDTPVVPTPDYDGWWVNLNGDFHSGDNGVQPVDGIAEWTNQAIGNNEVYVKVWDATNKKDLFFYAPNAIPVETWTTLTSASDWTPSTIEGQNVNSVYDVKYNIKENSIFFTLVSDEPAPENAIYLVGAGDGLAWELPGKVVEASADGSYTFTIDNLSMFKFSGVRTTSWDDFNANAYVPTSAFTDEVANNGGQTVGLNTSDANINLPWTGTYTITISKDFSTIKAYTSTPKPGAGDLDLYIRGSMTGTDWPALPEWKMTYNQATGAYEFACYDNGKGNDLVIRKDSEFKFSDDNWGVNFGAPTDYEPVTVDIVNNVANMDLTKGGKNLTFDKDFVGIISLVIDGNNATVTFKYDPETGVAGIEADGAEAEYFNLQGVKVANPEKGIFIKVANGKASKVVL